MAESCYICNNHKTNYKIQKLYINEKGTSFISEIGKYFKNNDATSAMNKIMEITRTLSFSEKRLFGEQSRCYCKYSQIACTAITAIQYNILATARRFSSYETI